MKNIKLIMIIVAFATIISCSKNEAIVENATVKQETNRQFADDVYVKDGTLHFESEDKFFEVATKIANMSDNEYNRLVSKTGFKSFRTNLDAKQILHEENINQIIESKSYNTNVDGDCKVTKIESSIPSAFYRSIANEDGVFYVNGIKNVVEGTQITGYMPNATKSENTLIGSASYEMNLDKTRAALYFIENIATSTERAAITRPTIYYNSVHTPNGMRKQGTLEIFMDAKKKNIFSSWKDYSTIYSVENIRIDGVSYGNRGTSSDAKSTTFIIPFDLMYHSNFRIAYGYATRGTIKYGYVPYNPFDGTAVKLR